MRLFLAIVLPGELCAKIQESKKVLDLKGVKITPDSHITLKFLGEVEEDKISILKRKMEEVKFEPFKLKISKTELFPNEDYVTNVYLTFEESLSLRTLRSKILKSCKGFGKQEKRDFLPHVTLARVKFAEDKKALVEACKSINFSGTEFKVNEFYLIKSVLNEKGPEYEYMGSYSFI
jgi:RNA 2',3'-cyclic 3'-phosphodiesterase